MPGMQATWWSVSLDAGSPIDDAGDLSTAGAGSGVLGSCKEWHCRDHEAAFSSTLSAAQRLVVVATLRWITNACGYGAADVWVGASPHGDRRGVESWAGSIITNHSGLLAASGPRVPG